MIVTSFISDKAFVFVAWVALTLSIYTQHIELQPVFRALVCLKSQHLNNNTNKTTATTTHTHTHSLSLSLSHTHTLTHTFTHTHTHTHRFTDEPLMRRKIYLMGRNPYHFSSCKFSGKLCLIYTSRVTHDTE